MGAAGAATGAVCGDGSVVVTMTVTARDNFRSFVLTFLDHAEVLEPADLREEIIGWLKAQVVA